MMTPKVDRRQTHFYEEGSSAPLEWANAGLKDIEEFNNMIKRRVDFARDQEAELELLIEENASPELIKEKGKIIDILKENIMELDKARDKVREKIKIFHEIHNKITEDLVNFNSKIEH